MPMPAYIYRALWRWHFYAGIFVLPFLFVLAVSGLGMLASGPLDRYRHAELLQVTPTGAPLAISAQLAEVAQTYPHHSIITVTMGQAPDASTPVSLAPGHAQTTHAGSHDAPQLLTVFVNPYTGKVLGDRDDNHTFYAWAKKLHGTLLLGIAGDYMIEIAAGFAVLLLVTGLYLWWPRNGRTLQQAALPAVRNAGQIRWRNLHAMLGLWTAPVLLFFLLSGLAWTPVWGGKMVQVWNSLPGESYSAPASEATHAALDHSAHNTVPWALEQTPLPAASPAHGTPGIEKAGRITVDDVADYARRNAFGQYRLHLPDASPGVWTLARTTISGDTPVLDGDRITHLDASTGNVLAEFRFADYPLLGKFMAASIPLHQADTGGINLLVNVVLCLAVATLCVAALCAWWSRRPQGVRLAPPPLPANPRVWHVAVALMLVLSLAFPLAALTIVLVLVVDFLLLRRIPALRVLFDQAGR